MRGGHDAVRCYDHAAMLRCFHPPFPFLPTALPRSVAGPAHGAYRALGSGQNTDQARLEVVIGADHGEATLAHVLGEQRLGGLDLLDAEPDVRADGVLEQVTRLPLCA